MRTRGTGGAKVPVGLPGGPSALQEHGVLARGRGQSQLVEGQDFTPVGHDSLSGLLGDVKGDNGQVLGDLEDPGVLCDGADHNGDLTFASGFAHQPG